MSSFQLAFVPAWAILCSLTVLLAVLTSGVAPDNAVLAPKNDVASEHQASGNASTSGKSELELAEIDGSRNQTGNEEVRNDTFTDIEGTKPGEKPDSGAPFILHQKNQSHIEEQLRPVEVDGELELANENRGNDLDAEEDTGEAENEGSRNQTGTEEVRNDTFTDIEATKPEGKPDSGAPFNLHQKNQSHIEEQLRPVEVDGELELANENRGNDLDAEEDTSEAENEGSRNQTGTEEVRNDTLTDIEATKPKGEQDSEATFTIYQKNQSRIEEQIKPTESVDESKTPLLPTTNPAPVLKNHTKPIKGVYEGYGSPSDENPIGPIKILNPFKVINLYERQYLNEKDNEEKDNEEKEERISNEDKIQHFPTPGNRIEMKGNIRTIRY